MIRHTLGWLLAIEELPWIWGAGAGFTGVTICFKAGAIRQSVKMKRLQPLQKLAYEAPDLLYSCRSSAIAPL